MTPRPTTTASAVLRRLLDWRRPAPEPAPPQAPVAAENLSPTSSVRFFPHWNPYCVKQLHGLIALILDIQARAEHHRVWVECGSLHGESAALFLAFPFVEQLHCIDIRSFPTLQQRLRPLLKSGRCVFHLGTSQERAAEIPVADVVYIDANHSYQAVRDDIAVWYPRITPGGALCGHDYYQEKHWPGVKRAVDDFISREQLTLTTYADSSWMVLKPKA